MAAKDTIRPITLFISDLHLSPEDTAATDRFFRFLAHIAPRAQALYILGDLFEAWIGDDDLDLPLHAGVAKALRALHQHGVDLFVMHGNRDFLLGQAFCDASGAVLLPEACVVDLYGTRTLLLHGDSLCTDDIAYKALRAQMRDPAWQQSLLARPLAERRLIAQRLRAESQTAKDAKDMAIMDVNAAAVTDAFRQHGCRRMIHGHTHRPAQHQHQVDSMACERWVLPDWYAAGGYLACSASGCALRRL